MRMYTDQEMDALVRCSVEHDEMTAAEVRHVAEERREIERLVAEHRL